MVWVGVNEAEGQGTVVNSWHDLYVLQTIQSGCLKLFTSFSTFPPLSLTGQTRHRYRGGQKIADMRHRQGGVSTQAIAFDAKREYITKMLSSTGGVNDKEAGN